MRHGLVCEETAEPSRAKRTPTSQAHIWSTRPAGRKFSYCVSSGLTRARSKAEGARVKLEDGGKVGGEILPVVGARI